jgi:hypothetical protein
MEQLPPPSPQASPFFDVRMRGFRDRVHVETVIGMVDDHSPPLPAETVPLTEAFGRVLASPLCAEVAVPGFNRAAMDGYAVRAEETFGATAYNPLSLTVVGQVLPGQPFAGVVESGQAVRIMTGAPMPDGADAVVPAEYAQEVGSIVRITEAVPPARHVSRVGEDIAPGRQLFAAGRVLRPQDLGLLASVGIGTVPVVRRPTVAVIITGDELLPPGSKPSGYQIVDSNSPMLAALVQRDGGQVRLLPIVPDQPEALRQAMQTASAEADVLLISGGSSVGREDHAPGCWPRWGGCWFTAWPCARLAPPGWGNSARRWYFCCRAIRCRVCVPTICSPAGPFADSPGCAAIGPTCDYPPASAAKSARRWDAPTTFACVGWGRRPPPRPLVRSNRWPSAALRSSARPPSPMASHWSMRLARATPLARPLKFICTTESLRTHRDHHNKPQNPRWPARNRRGAVVG